MQFELSAGFPRATELYQELRRAILDGELAPRQRLVEREIARKYSVSRTPVREAIHRLEMEGLVESSSRGAAVIDIGAAQLSELCSVRESLEGFAARLAASSASDLDISTLHALHDAAEDAVGAEDVAKQIDLNHVFHETIWHSTRNRYLMRQLGIIRDLIERRGRTTLSTGDRQREALDEHRAIMDAIARRDPIAAEEAAEHHFRAAMLARLLDEHPARGLT